MNKIILMAASVVAMVGCAKQFEPAISSSKEITFSSPVIAPSTKAVITGTSYASTDGSFGVYSVWKDGDLTAASNWGDEGNKTFMSNVEVSHAANLKESYGGWKASTAYFWPAKGKLNFLAYRPYAASGSSVVNGCLKFTDYVVNMQAEPVDLLYSSLVKNQTENSVINNYYGVDIPFHHALSQITFNAKTKADYTTGTTTDVNNVVIKLTSVKLTANTTSTGTQTADNAISWNTATTSQQSYEIVKAAGGIELSNTELDAAGVTAGFNELLAMPQNFAEDNNVKIDIKYTVNFTGLDNTAVEKTETVVLNTLSFSDSSKAFAANKKYIFTIIIGLEEVSFAPKVTAWEATAVTADANVQ